MAYLARALKQDLKLLAEELRIGITDDMRVIDLCKAITTHPDYDEAITKNLLAAVAEDRKLREQQEERRYEEEKQKRNHELQSRTMMQQQTTIVVQQPPAYSPVSTDGYMVVQPVPLLGESPMTVVCGNCGNKVTTTIVPENGACAHLCALMMFFIFLPCVCYPLCSGSCKDYSHYCSNCNAKLGTYRRM
ncbi:unnamed protein product [Larinioides sclopetarius]|uniref:LITAF domain-containing protein n=1 Tax=Larinioides sclopetarius TaxID=280406 RepID=A0AAV2BXB3_9ARAC